MMKKVAYFAAVTVVFAAALISCHPAMAQQGGGRAFGGQTGMILADALVLDTAKAEKVTTVYSEVRQQVMESVRGNADFQSMTQDERREMMTKIQTETAAKLKEALKGVLSEKELAAIDPLLAVRFGSTVVELRALRQIELTAEQRAEIQPSAIAVASNALPGFRPQGQEPSAEAQKKFDDAKAAFMAKANSVLKDEQKKAWEEKIAAVQKEQEEMRARRQQRGQ